MAGRHNTARHTKTLTDAQKQAILKAHLVDGHTPADIRRMAAAGNLENLPAFELTTHIYTVIRYGRERFELDNDQALAHSTKNELKRLHRLNLKHSRQLDAKTDPAEIARIAKALADTERALGTKTEKPKTRPGQTNAQNNATPDNDTSQNVLDQLVKLSPRNAPSNGDEGARGPVRSLARSNGAAPSMP